MLMAEDVVVLTLSAWMHDGRSMLQVMGQEETASTLGLSMTRRRAWLPSIAALAWYPWPTLARTATPASFSSR
jgi:hypothetical protein